MNRFTLTLLPFVVFTFSGTVSAVVSIDYVSVGYAGNAADNAREGETRYGAVAYEYKIAKNETTIGQYVEFLNVAAKSGHYTRSMPVFPRGKTTIERFESSLRWIARL